MRLSTSHIKSANLLQWDYQPPVISLPTSYNKTTTSHNKGLYINYVITLGGSERPTPPSWPLLCRPAGTCLLVECASFYDLNSGNGRRNFFFWVSIFLAHIFDLTRGHYLPPYEMEWRNWKAAEWPSKCTWILGSDGLGLHIKVWPSISITFYLTINSRYIFFASDTSTSDGSPPEQVTKTLAEKY